MLIAIWLLACTTVAFASRNRPLVLVGLAFTIWTLVPAAASPMLVGQLPGSLAYRAGSWFIICCVSVLILAEPRELLDELARRFPTYLCLALVVLEAILVARLSPDRGGVVIVVDQVLCPVLLFFVTGAAVGSGRGSITLIRNWIIVLAAVESAISLTQFVAGSALFYQKYYATFAWFHAATETRWMGTTDHPLALSLLLCAALPLLAGLGRLCVQIPLAVMLAAGVLATQSRTGLVVCAFGIIYLVFASRLDVGLKYLTLVLMGVGAYFVASFALAAGVQHRIADDTGSTLARSTALQFFLSNWKEYLVTGNGISSSFQVSKFAGLQTSLESSVLMYGVGLGLIFALLYFGAQAAVVLRSMFGKAPRGAAMCGFVLLIVPQTYSALATESLAGPLLWLGLAVAASRQPNRSFGANPDASAAAPSVATRQVGIGAQERRHEAPSASLTRS